MGVWRRRKGGDGGERPLAALWGRGLR